MSNDPKPVLYYLNVIPSLPSSDHCSCLFYIYRDVLSSPQVLNMPERVDWRNCKLSKDKETQLARQFKEDFKNYDFNLD